MQCLNSAIESLGESRALVNRRDGDTQFCDARSSTASRHDFDASGVQAGREFKLLGQNRLEEMTLATPAIADGSLFIRTASKLYRIGTTR